MWRGWAGPASLPYLKIRTPLAIQLILRRTDSYASAHNVTYLSYVTFDRRDRSGHRYGTVGARRSILARCHMGASMGGGTSSIGSVVAGMVMSTVAKKLMAPKLRPCGWHSWRGLAN